METKRKLPVFFLVLVASIFLASCQHRQIVSKSTGTLVKQTVKLHVVGNPKEIKVKTPGMANCKAASPANGCIAIGRRETGLITFELKTSPDWYFNEFEICPGGTKPLGTCSLENWQRAEFFATDGTASSLLFPDGDGIIDLTKLSSSLTKFYLFDYNSAAQDFFYRIKVCNDNASPSCLSLDPEIQNKGRN